MLPYREITNNCIPVLLFISSLKCPNVRGGSDSPVVTYTNSRTEASMRRNFPDLSKWHLLFTVGYFFITVKKADGCGATD